MRLFTEHTSYLYWLFTELPLLPQHDKQQFHFVHGMQCHENIQYLYI